MEHVDSDSISDEEDLSEVNEVEEGNEEKRRGDFFLMMIE